MSTVVVSYEAAILSRMMLPEEPILSRDAAESVLKLGFSALDQKRMETLAEKARRGSLTDEEREEADSYERISSLIGRRATRRPDGNWPRDRYRIEGQFAPPNCPSAIADRREGLSAWVTPHWRRIDPELLFYV